MRVSTLLLLGTVFLVACNQGQQEPVPESVEQQQESSSSMPTMDDVERANIDVRAFTSFGSSSFNYSSWDQFDQ